MSFINYNTKNKVTIFPGVQSAMEHSAQISYGCVTLEEGCYSFLYTAIRMNNGPILLKEQMEFTLNGEKQLLLPGMGAFIASNVLHGAVASYRLQGY